MRIFLAWLLLAVVAVAAPAKGNREAQLERVKAAFPRCVAVLNDRTDPMIAECYRGWKERAEALTVENLSAEVVAMRRTLHNEMRDLTIQEADPHRLLRSDTRAAIRKNLGWLRLKVSPWINQLAAVQQGR